MTERTLDRARTGETRGSSPPIDEEGLRHPLETRIFVLSVILNVGLVILAVVLATNAPDWLKSHPIIEKNLRNIKALATGLVLAPFALTYARNARRSYVRGNSVALSREQIPEMYEWLEKLCAQIRLDPIPGLFLSQTGISDFSTAFTARGENFIVLGTKFVEPNYARVREVLSFTLARELGRIRLGHTKWYDELLLAYVVRIPVLRDPLQKIRELSLDRYAAALVPDGLPGLLVMASGRLLLHNVNVADYLAQADAYHGLWRWIADVGKKDVPAMLRVRALYAAGLFDREADLRRFARAPASKEWPVDAQAKSTSPVATTATTAPQLVGH